MNVEIWTSDHNRKEVHYFIPGGDTGYQHNTYLFGYNPERVSSNTVQKILKLIEDEQR